ncbi:MAG: hypothetical protein KDD62_02165 [Bdellovibrionales bacterium]|nr:hypothetical protein [Bdellovibrionales bacterium]
MAGKQPQQDQNSNRSFDEMAVGVAARAIAAKVNMVASLPDLALAQFQGATGNDQAQDKTHDRIIERVVEGSKKAGEAVENAYRNLKGK